MGVTLAKNLQEDIARANAIDVTADEPELNIQRGGNSIAELCRKTKFSRQEIQLLYRSFKQECPNGILSLEQFKNIYSHFFPSGDAGPYASLVFRTFDLNANGQINFEEFVQTLSRLSRGTLEDQLHWAFSLYDTRLIGSVSKTDMTTVLEAVYQLQHVSHDTVALEKHVEWLFEQMDRNGDSLITLEEFMSYCTMDSLPVKSLQLFAPLL